MSYEIFGIAAGAMLMVMGLIMTIAPRSATKKDARDHPETVKKTRRYGIIMLACGAFVLVYAIIRAL